MPHYLLSVCYPADAQPPAPEQLQTITADVLALNERMRAAGVWVFGGGLHEPATSTVVTYQNGDIALTDGPFVEAKEQIGGITIIDAADLDTALEWASQLARAVPTPIEVRPFEGWAS